MGMKIKFNAALLEASIENIAKTAAKNAAAEMRKTAVKVRDLARDYAPVDSGALERAIDYMTVRSGTTRRNVFVVYVDMDLINPKSGKEVGDYAWIMEEELHPYGRQKGERRYHLGPRSAAKAAGGKKVGGRFLSRAVKEGTAELLAKTAGAVTRTLNGSRLVNINYERDTGDDE